MSLLLEVNCVVDDCSWQFANWKSDTDVMDILQAAKWGLEYCGVSSTVYDGRRGDHRHRREERGSMVKIKGMISKVTNDLRRRFSSVEAE